MLSGMAMLQHEEDVIQHLKNSVPSGKLFSLGTIESSIVEFIMDTSSNNDGVRGDRLIP